MRSSVKYRIVMVVITIMILLNFGIINENYEFNFNVSYRVGKSILSVDFDNPERPVRMIATEFENPESPARLLAGDFDNPESPARLLAGDFDNPESPILSKA